MLVRDVGTRKKELVFGPVKTVGVSTVRSVTHLTGAVPSVGDTLNKSALWEGAECPKRVTCLTACAAGAGDPLLLQILVFIIKCKQIISGISLSFCFLALQFLLVGKI